MKRYFKNFKKLKKLMLFRADGLRNYVPTTFDETMVEFGFKLERRRICEKVQECIRRMDVAVA